MPTGEVNNLTRRAFAGFLNLQVILALLLFTPAWSLHYWQAWIYLIVFGGSTLLITLYFLKHDPSLIERRIEAGPGAEKERTQKIIQAIAAALFVALMVVPGLDHRFHWSHVPVPIVLAADLLVALGFLIVFLVFRENTYTAGTIKVEAEQRVISTGPYSMVRHPMYSGGLMLILATSLALGSVWGMLLGLAMCVIIVVRLLDEEKYLSANLKGYREYCAKVRYRLVPALW